MWSVKAKEMRERRDQCELEKINASEALFQL